MTPWRDFIIIIAIIIQLERRATKLPTNCYYARWCLVPATIMHAKANGNGMRHGKGTIFFFFFETTTVRRLT